ncbi:hypothetical protein ACJZ2D_005727 [Fusarium nematophilum]
MMRSTVPRRAQARQKMFVRNTDKNGEIYYTLNRWGYAKPKVPKDHELFQINDLLLDLDDMDSRHVRPSTEDDEEQMLKRWSVDRKRQGIENRLQQLKNEVDWSRQKVFEISSRPINIWRLGSHDILSAALRGLTSSAPLVDSLGRQQGSASVLTTETPGLRQQHAALSTICSENGISERALENDELLLRWLQLRHQTAQPEQHIHRPAPSPAQFTKALQEQDSVAGIRRLVSQSLSSGLNVAPFHESPRQTRGTNLSSEVRHACANILNQSQEKDATCHDLVAFLGNLGQRLSPNGAHIGAPLCGLGLRLSAEICKPEATMQFLNIGFMNDYWTDNDEGISDVLSTLQTYSHYLNTPSRSEFLDVHDCQTILKLLTGVCDNGELTQESIRSLALHFLGTSSGGLEVYRAYIVLLGQLGAVASLWQESRLSETKPEERARDGKLPVSEATLVSEAFQSAIRAALSVVALRSDAVPMDHDLAGCATLDLKSIKMQDHDARLGYQQEEVRPMREFVDGEIRAALDLPLNEWLEAVRRLAQ